jgi:hypothetical protein
MVQTFPDFESENPIAKSVKESRGAKSKTTAKCLKRLVAGSGIEPPTYGL